MEFRENVLFLFQLKIKEFLMADLTFDRRGFIYNYI